MKYLGDFIEDAVVRFSFTMNAADGGRENPSNAFEEADITILKDGAAMAVDASTITISNPGTMTGHRHVVVDMSNDADFTTGAEYEAVLYPDETVDSQSVAAVLAQWSCENRTAAVRDKTGFSLSTAGILAIWDQATSALTTAGRIGKLLVDNINATISSRMPTSHIDATGGVVDEVAALTGHTAQTGDSYARLGAPAGASLAADIAANKSVVDGIQSDLDNATDGLGALKALIDAIQADLDNGTDGLGALKALLDTIDTTVTANNTAIGSLNNTNWTDQLTESYAADGVAPTVAQALFMILQNLQSVGLSGTTRTVRQLDDSTVAMTYTTDDSADPTSYTRTT